MSNNNKIGMRGEPLFIDEASTSFSFFIIFYLPKISLGELQKVTCHPHNEGD
jgi:hypothetical protein